ncbi:MAG: hypothetical protein ACI86H_000978 [bacterium]|jgi:hypothetical protein
MKVKWIQLIVFCFCLIGFSASLQAREFFRMGQGFRALAMGNTGIASANDNSTLFYNPAALANIHTWWADAFLHAEYNEGATQLLASLQSGGLSSSTQADSLTFVSDFETANAHAKLQFGANLFINVADEGFTIGANYFQELILQVKGSAGNDITISGVTINNTNIDILARLDTVSQGGISIPIGVGQLVLGLAYRTVKRKYMSATYTLEDAYNSVSFPSFPDNATIGEDTSYDIGLMYRFANAARITIAAVARNIGGMDFGTLGDTYVEAKEPEEYAVGISMSPTWGIFRLTMAVDIRDLTYNWPLPTSTDSTTDTTLTRRIHAGIELGLFPNETYNFISIRAGYSQGQPSYGAEVSFGKTTVLGYTVYYEETGETAGDTADKRQAFYISFGF